MIASHLQTTKVQNWNLPITKCTHLAYQTVNGYFQPIELGPRNTGAYKDDDTVIDTVRRRLSSLKEKKRESRDKM